MTDSELVEALINETPQRITKVGEPTLSDLVEGRRIDAEIKKAYPDSRLTYKTYDDIADDEIYDPFDFATVGNKVRSNIVDAITERFPVTKGNYTLAIENLKYENPKNRTLSEEKEVMKSEASLIDRLKGDWVLYDNTTGKEIQRVNKTLLNVPRMTERGTFIRNGSEYGLKHMFRLRPGLYARTKQDGTPSVHINPAQTAGRQMSINMDQASGVMTIKRETRTYGVLPMLRAAGVSDDAIKAAWGEEVFNMNKNKYARLLANPDGKQFKEYQDLWVNDFLPIKLDPETTLSTTGKPYESMNADALLTASNKVLKLSRSGSVEDEDDRDSLQYQRIMGPADYIPERIVRDGGGLIRKLVQDVMRSGRLDKIEAGALQPHVDSVFLEDRHAGYIDGASPFEALDLASNVSRIGEGGIGDTKAAPAETRGVNDSYLGFIDPVRSVECYSRKHELYTDNGWVNITEITEDSKLACFICGKIEYHKPTAIHKYVYTDKLYSHTDSEIAYEVTGNHRMLLLGAQHDTHQAISDNMVEKLAMCMDSGQDTHRNDYVAVHVDDDPNSPIYTIPLCTSADGDDIYHKLVDGDGEVFCVSVPGGRVFTRIPGYRGFWCGNSLKVGLEVYMSYGVKKDSKGNLYANFIDKTGKKALRPMGLVSSSYVATPEYYNPDADPEEFIPAFAKGKGIEYIQRKDVDFYLASSNNMMSIGAGMIPAIGGIRSNRTLMGCLHPETPVLIVRDDKELIMSAEQLLNEFKEGDSVISLSDDMSLAKIRPIRQVVKSNASDYYEIAVNELIKVKVTGNHKWYDLKTKKLIATSDITEEGIDIPLYWGLAEGVVTAEVVAVKLEDTTYDYSIDIDVDDNLYMLANGMFTHNSKYPLQALPLKHREAPLVQRGMQLDDGSESTTEKYVSKQLGAKYAPVSGKVTYVDDDEIVIKGIDGQRHTVSLYNNYPANQKGFLHNTATVKVGDRVSEKQCIAASNYTDDSGTAALGTNLKVAFMTGRGAGAFEDATYISESCAKKLASEQLYKFRGDMSSETGYGKEKFINLFGQQDYTAEQLAKIDDNGFPKEGTVFHKGDPVFLGYQIRDLSTSGLSRTASVPYVKTWEHEVPGTVIDVVKGRKHMTVYTKSYAPAVPGDKLCFDDKTEIMTKRGWILIKDLLQDDKVLTLDINTCKNYFTDFDAAFRYECENELLYHLTTKRLDIFVTKDHKHPVAAMNNARYIMFQSSEQIFGKQRYFLTGCNLQSASNYACSRDEKAKERWEKYTGSVYCVMVPDTHTVYVRRNGKTVWSGNSGRYGNKAEISMVVPDDKMPRSADGTPFDIIASPLSLPSRLNTSMLAEAQLSKIAKATGKTYTLPDFMEETLPDFVDRELKKHGMQSTEDVYDPETGKTIPGVESGYMFYYKLKHTAEYKERGRATGTYSSEEVPLKGEGAARRLGMMETSAVYSGGGMDVLRDAKLIRGQRNDEFWRDYRDGKTPDVPTTPLVHKKFFAHLVGSGAKITQPELGTFRLSTATDADIKELTGKREVKQAATFNSKNMQPIDGGLFDPQIFGADGDRWGYFQLPEPVLNPLMFKPIAGVLGWTDTELREYLQGQRKIDNEFGSEALMRKLDSIDLTKELNSAKNVLKAQGTTLQQRDLARKRIRAISPMIKQGTKPSDYFFTRMPILPPRYRTVTTINGGETNIAADANFLYKRMIDAALDLGAAKSKLPGEFQVDARNSLYNSVNALVGLQPTDDPKLEAKGVAGLLKWAFGKGSPKSGSTHRKIFGSNLDLGGLGVIIPDSKLTIDQVGIPEESAWKMFEPFVVRELKGRGFSTLQAMKQVLERSPEARQELINVMKTRPILLNRAPTLWRYGIQGQMPVLVEGNAIRINPNICGVYGADFDGDTCKDFVNLMFSTEIYKKLLDISDKCDILYDVTQPKECNMLQKEAKVSLVNRRIAICDIPVVEGSSIQINDNVVEWDVPSGVYTEAIDRTSGESIIVPVTKLSQHKDVDMYDITLETYGAYKHIITVSKEGTLLAYKDGEVAIVDASESLGMVVPRLRSTNGICKDTDLVARYIDIGKKYPLGYDLGVFLGLMIGDGWVDQNFTTHLAAENAEIQAEMIRVTDPETGAIDTRKPSGLFAHRTDRFGEDVAHRLTIYLEKGAPQILRKLIGSGAPNKMIPMQSLAASKAHRIGVLVGLLATDGSVNFSEKPAKGKKSSQKSILFHTTSQLLRDGIIELCRSLGVRATATPYMGANSVHQCYAINLSVRDMAKLASENSKMRMIPKKDQQAFEQICNSIDFDEIDPYDPVPAPAHLRILLGQALYDQMSAGEITRYTKMGYMSRVKAREVVKALREFDYSTYTEKNKGKVRPGYTPEQVKELADKWIAIVENTDVCWEVVTGVNHLGLMDGWDITVPGPLTFSLGGGTFVQDSMSTHVPVSNEAVRAIKENMMPSKNLLSPKNFKAHFVPKDAANEGLYLASRIGAGDPIRFRTEEEAQEAFRKGEIKIDTPIIIG